MGSVVILRIDKVRPARESYFLVQRVVNQDGHYPALLAELVLVRADFLVSLAEVLFCCYVNDGVDFPDNYGVLLGFFAFNPQCRQVDRLITSHYVQLLSVLRGCQTGFRIEGDLLAFALSHQHGDFFQPAEVGEYAVVVDLVDMIGCRFRRPPVPCFRECRG